MCQKGYGKCNTVSSSRSSVSKSAPSPTVKSGSPSSRTSSSRTSLLPSSSTAILYTSPSRTTSFQGSPTASSSAFKAATSPSTSNLTKLSSSSSAASLLISLPASSPSKPASSSASPPNSSPSSSTRILSSASQSASSSVPKQASSVSSPQPTPPAASSIPQPESSLIAQFSPTPETFPALSSSASALQTAGSATTQASGADFTGSGTTNSPSSILTPTPTEISSSVNNDSPPFSPTGPFVAPTDVANFVENYTFEDDPLPTPVEMGSPPITTGLSALEPNLVKACIVAPTKPDVTFQLLDAKERNPLIRTPNGSIGVMKAPKSQEEYDAMGPIEDLKFASFSFATGSNGLFDLVINDSPRKYLARKSDGSVALTDQSTGSNDESLATTIFDVTCEGRITIRINSQYYNWTVNDSGSLIQAAEGSPDTMYTLPDSPTTGQKQRRSKSQEGRAPRCPPSPRDIDARVFPGARNFNPNKCGSSSFKVPDLTFGHCCDNHDNDFDTCSTTFEEANNNFHSCMRGSGCDQFNHWYLWPAYPACLKTADFYYSVVSSFPGVLAFCKEFYTKERQR